MDGWGLICHYCICVSYITFSRLITQVSILPSTFILPHVCLQMLLHRYAMLDQAKQHSSHSCQPSSLSLCPSKLIHAPVLTKVSSNTDNKKILVCEVKEKTRTEIPHTPIPMLNIFMNNTKIDSLHQKIRHPRDFEDGDDAEKLVHSSKNLHARSDSKTTRSSIQYPHTFTVKVRKCSSLAFPSSVLPRVSC